MTKIIVEMLRPGHFKATMPEMQWLLGLGNTPMEAVGDLVFQYARSGNLIIEFTPPAHELIRADREEWD